MREAKFALIVLVGLLMAFYVALFRVDEIKRKAVACAQDQIDYFGDLCAEHEGSDPEWKDEDAYFFGTKCAVETIKMCVEDLQ